MFSKIQLKGVTINFLGKLICILRKIPRNSWNVLTNQNCTEHKWHNNEAIQDLINCLTKYNIYIKQMHASGSFYKRRKTRKTSISINIVWKYSIPQKRSFDNIYNCIIYCIKYIKLTDSLSNSDKKRKNTKKKLASRMT